MVGEVGAKWNFNFADTANNIMSCVTVEMTATGLTTTVGELVETVDGWVTLRIAHSQVSAPVEGYPIVYWGNAGEFTTAQYDANSLRFITCLSK